MNQLFKSFLFVYWLLDHWTGWTKTCNNYNHKNL